MTRFPKITLTAIYKGPVPDPTDPEPTITLGVASFPQVHTLYHYNVATGVVASSLRNPSFTRVLSAVAANGKPAQYQTVRGGGDVYAAPAMFFTAHLLGPMRKVGGSSTGTILSLNPRSVFRFPLQPTTSSLEPPAKCVETCNLYTVITWGK